MGVRNKDLFRVALDFTLRWEGGLSNHPDDPGGLTNKGITQRTYDAWRTKNRLPKRSVKEITQEEVEAIYAEYWVGVGADDLPPPLAVAAFDLAVNSGVGTARRLLSEAKGSWELLCAMRLRFLADIKTFNTFGRGWVRRVSDLIRLCHSLEEEAGRLAGAKRLFVNGSFTGRIERASLVGDKLYVRLAPQGAGD